MLVLLTKELSKNNIMRQLYEHDTIDAKAQAKQTKKAQFLGSSPSVQEILLEAQVTIELPVTMKWSKFCLETLMPQWFSLSLAPLLHDWVELCKHTLHLYALIVFTPPSFSLPESSSCHRRLLTHARSRFLLFSLPLSRSLPPPCPCGSVKEMLYPDSCSVLHSCHVSTQIPGLVWPK